MFPRKTGRARQQQSIYMAYMDDMLPLLLAVSIAVGCLSIVGACYHWVRNKMFGLAGVVLSIMGLSLLGASLWVSLLYAAPRSERSSADNTAFQRIEDSNAKTLTAIRDSNKLLADQLQQSVKQLQD